MNLVLSPLLVPGGGSQFESFLAAARALEKQPRRQKSHSNQRHQADHHPQDRCTDSQRGQSAGRTDSTLPEQRFMVN